ncbi:MAG: hypothetical protein SGJ00_11570 [bacterium]|nr:hypothetical protein [bacterium]
MKSKLTILFSFLFLSKFGSAQYEPAYTTKADKSLYATYLGLGTGIKGKYGILGIDFGMRLSEKTLAEVNLGLGLWGYKSGVSFTTFAGKNNTWCPSIGFTRNYGLNQFLYAPEVRSIYDGDAFMLEKTLLNFKPINVLHLSVQRQFLNKKGNRFFVELGISMALNEVNVEFDEAFVKDGINGAWPFSTKELRFTSKQLNSFKQQSPGGINISVGYQFGMGKFN